MMMPISPDGPDGDRAVSAAFGLERDAAPFQRIAPKPEHILDHVVRPNAKNFISNLRRQMTISEMPRKAHQLTRDLYV